MWAPPARAAYDPARITSTPRDDQSLVRDDHKAPCTNQFSTFVNTISNVTSVLLNKIQSILASCINHILLCYVFHSISIKLTKKILHCNKAHIPFFIIFLEEEERES